MAEKYLANGDKWPYSGGMRGGLERWKRGVESAYASTVHGVQGETADASVVGPDVDAAGLYVGLTRGRLHRVAIVVARTDGAARESLADSMQRGIPELTMQDAVRAAQAEVRRAARNRKAAMVTAPRGNSPSSGRGIGM